MGLAQSGDRVIIPSGTCNWTTTLSWSAPANVQVLGNGGATTTTQGGSGATIIQDNVSGNTPLMSITTNATGYFRLSNITIRGGSGGIKEGGMIAIRGDSALTRVDHVTIDKSTYSPQNTGKFMVIGGMVRGVIDNTKLDAGTDIAWIHFVNGEDAYHGGTTWTQNTGFGTADFMYVEDTHLIARRSGSLPPRGTYSDCHTGGKFVIRFSSTLNGNVGQTHPTGHGGDDRGCRAFELYKNTVTNDHGTDEQTFAFSYNNSGPQLMWGNNIGSGTYKNVFYLNICRVGTPCGYSPPYGGWGECTGSSSWDENSTGGSGYACLDQPGRGKGDLITGTFGVGGGKVNDAFGTAAWPRQLHEPMYEWLTTGTRGTGWGGDWLANQDGTRIQQNRDFFMDYGDSGCEPNAATCATGVGVGTLAQRPTNCALNTAYWATDQGNWNGYVGAAQGALYKCASTNTWSLYYTPYKYPHPLRVRFGPAAPTVN